MSDTYFGINASKRFGRLELRRGPTDGTPLRFHRSRSWWHATFFGFEAAWPARFGRAMGFYTFGLRELVIELPIVDKNSRGTGFDGKKDTVRWYLRAPWHLELHHRELLLRHNMVYGKLDPQVSHPSGVWVHVPRGVMASDTAPKWELPFAWTNPKTGEVDRTTVTVHGERTTWRRKWLKWCNLFAQVDTHVYLEFKDEVGPGKGSWKGGLIGTSFKIKPGETIEQTVERAQTELKIRDRV